jgi:hypothetical protein
MVIVDSIVWIDYFRGVDNAHSLWLDTQLQHLRLGLTVCRCARCYKAYVISGN